MAIPGSYLKLLRSKINILDVLSDYCDFHRSGDNYFSQCPFPDHIDKDPSFSCHPGKEMFYCFGCRKGGNMFTFLMKLQGLNFPEAVRAVAAKAGIDFPYSTDGETRRDQLYSLMGAAAATYYTAGQNPQFMRYFTEERKLRVETIQNYGLGYCTGNWAVAAGQKYDHEILKSSGLFYESGYSYGEVMKNRWTFPMVNLAGKVFAIGGKSLTDTARYRNTSDSDIYHKKENLYGVFQAKDHIRRMGFVVLVEGYFDVLTLSQNGYPNTVGVCGTAFSESHAKLLKRLTNKVVLMLDGDASGQKAVHNAFAYLFSSGMDYVLVAQPPKDVDPDDLFKADREAGVMTVQKSIPYLDWLIPSDLDQVGKEEKVLEVRKVISQVQDQTRRFMLTSFCSARIGVSERALSVGAVLPPAARKEDLPGSVNEILLLAAMLTNPIGPEENRELAQIRWSHEHLSAVYDRIVKLQEEATKEDVRVLLYDDLSEDQIELVTEIVKFSDAVGTSNSLRTRLNIIKRENNRKRLHANIQELYKRDEEGRDGSALLLENRELMHG